MGNEQRGGHPGGRQGRGKNFQRLPPQWRDSRKALRQKAREARTYRARQSRQARPAALPNAEALEFNEVLLFAFRCALAFWHELEGVGLTRGRCRGVECWLNFVIFLTIFLYAEFVQAGLNTNVRNGEITTTFDRCFNARTAQLMRALLSHRYDYPDAVRQNSVEFSLATTLRLVIFWISYLPYSWREVPVVGKIFNSRFGAFAHSVSAWAWLYLIPSLHHNKFWGRTIVTEAEACQLGAGALQATSLPETVLPESLKGVEGAITWIPNVGGYGYLGLLLVLTMMMTRQLPPNPTNWLRLLTYCSRRRHRPPSVLVDPEVQEIAVDPREMLVQEELDDRGQVFDPSESGAGPSGVHAPSSLLPSMVGVEPAALAQGISYLKSCRLDLADVNVVYALEVLYSYFQSCGLRAICRVTDNMPALLQFLILHSEDELCAELLELYCQAAIESNLPSRRAIDIPPHVLWRYRHATLQDDTYCYTFAYFIKRWRRGGPADISDWVLNYITDYYDHRQLLPNHDVLVVLYRRMLPEDRSTLVRFVVSAEPPAYAPIFDFLLNEQGDQLSLLFEIQDNALCLELLDQIFDCVERMMADPPVNLDNIDTLLVDFFAATTKNIRLNLSQEPQARHLQAQRLFALFYTACKSFYALGHKKEEFGREWQIPGAPVRGLAPANGERNIAEPAWLKFKVTFLEMCRELGLRQQADVDNCFNLYLPEKDDRRQVRYELLAAPPMRAIYLWLENKQHPCSVIAERLDKLLRFSRNHERVVSHLLREFLVKPHLWKMVEQDRLNHPTSSAASMDWEVRGLFEVLNASYARMIVVLVALLSNSEREQVKTDVRGVINNIPLNVSSVVVLLAFLAVYFADDEAMRELLLYRLDKALAPRSFSSRAGHFLNRIFSLTHDSPYQTQTWPGLRHSIAEFFERVVRSELELPPVFGCDDPQKLAQLKQALARHQYLSAVELSVPRVGDALSGQEESVPLAHQRL